LDSVDLRSRIYGYVYLLRSDVVVAFPVPTGLPIAGRLPFPDVHHTHHTTHTLPSSTQLFLPRDQRFPCTRSTLHTLRLPPLDIPLRTYTFTHHTFVYVPTTTHSTPFLSSLIRMNSDCVFMMSLGGINRNVYVQSCLHSIYQHHHLNIVAHARTTPHTRHHHTRAARTKRICTGWLPAFYARHRTRQYTPLVPRLLLHTPTHTHTRTCTLPHTRTPLRTAHTHGTDKLHPPPHPSWFTGSHTYAPCLSRPIPAAPAHQPCAAAQPPLPSHYPALYPQPLPQCHAFPTHLQDSPDFPPHSAPSQLPPFPTACPCLPPPTLPYRYGYAFAAVLTFTTFPYLVVAGRRCGVVLHDQLFATYHTDRLDTVTFCDVHQQPTVIVRLPLLFNMTFVTRIAATFVNVRGMRQPVVLT